MAKGDKSGYSQKQKDEAHAIERHLQDAGESGKASRKKAWEHVDEKDGGRASGYGRAKHKIQRKDAPKKGGDGTGTGTAGRSSGTVDR